MWPFSVVVNELPKEIRYKKENIITIGLWYDKAPKMSTFLKPFVEEIKMLNEKRILIKNTMLKVIPIITPIDSCARPKLQCMTQFNGAFGCHICLHPGNNKYAGSTNNVMKYPHMENVPLRNLQDTLEILLKHPTKKSPINGINGQSILVELEEYDMIRGCPPDDLHSSYIGVGNQLLNLLLEKFLKPYLQLISKRLNELQLPSGILRLPRGIEDLTKWKGTDIKNFFIFYFYPCLQDLLPHQNFKHAMLFSETMHILSSSSISKSNLQKAKRNLQQFVKDYEKLYGTASMTFNVHSQGHMGQAVEDCGPLFAFSTFPFESKYGHMTKLIHGPTDIIKQLSLKISWESTMETVESKKDLDFYGKVLEVIPSEEFLEYLKRPSEKIKIKSYNRIKVNNIFYSVKPISNTEKTSKVNNSFVMLKNGVVGSISNIYEVDSKIHVKIRSDYFIANNQKYSHIVEITKKNNENIFCSFDFIKEKLLFLQTDSCTCISSFPNNLCLS
jgi:hypothetical protein